MNIISYLRKSVDEMEQDEDKDRSKSPKPNLTTYSTSSWSKTKNPRIVRVSKSFGGKDRHSKVCTVRGLRDRRVRLSGPTAIQLYDLQDRLGLNQPSKAVDWLLDVAKNEIDELPPLQIPPGTFGQNLQAMLNASSQERIKTANRSSSNGLNCQDHWNPDRSKPIARETSEDCDKHNQYDRNKHNPSNVPGLLHNVVPNSSFLKWDPSSLLLSQFGSYGSMASHQHNDNVLLYHPSSPQTQFYFPSHNHINSSEFDPKQLNFQMMRSSSSSSNFTSPLYTINQEMRPFHLSMNAKFFNSEDDGEHGLNK